MTKRSPSSAGGNQPDKTRGQSTALHRINSMGRQLFHAFTHSMSQSSASSLGSQSKSHCDQSALKRRTSTKETSSISSKQTRKSVAEDCCLSIISNANRHFQKQEAKREAKRRDEVQKSKPSDEQQEELFKLESDETETETDTVTFSKVVGPKTGDQFGTNYQRASFDIHACSRVAEPSIHNQANCNDPSTSTTTQPNSIKSSLLDDTNAAGYCSISKSKSICSQYARSKRNNSDRLSQLIELLDRIAERHKHAKQLDRANSTEPYEIDEGDAFFLERNWSQFVQIQPSRADSTKSVSCESLLGSQPGDITTPTDPNRSSDNQLNNLRIQQDAIWELVRTELLYIKGLKAMIDVFLATLNELQQSSFLLEIDPYRLMSNIQEIHEANSWFWLNYLNPMLARSRLTHCPLDPSLIRQAFVHIFAPYYRYCLELTDCLSYLKEQTRTNEQFRVYVAWCESHKDCDRLKLMDLLAKPTQRITRYSLLLKAIAKRTDCPDQLAALDQMVAHTDRFVLTVDLELRRRDDLNNLMEISSLIESYDFGFCEAYNNDEIEQLVRLHYRALDLTEPIFNCPFQCHRQLLFDSSTMAGSQYPSPSHPTSLQMSPRPELSKRLSPNRQDHKHLGHFKFRDAQSSNKIDIVLLLLTDQLLICRQVAASSANPGINQSLTKATDYESHQFASGSLGHHYYHMNYQQQQQQQQQQLYQNQLQQFKHGPSLPHSPSPITSFCFPTRARTGSGGQRLIRQIQNQDLRRQQLQLELMARNNSAANLSARALSLILAPSGFNLNDEIFSRSLQIEPQPNDDPNRQNSNNHTTASIHSSISSLSTREAFVQSSQSKSDNSQSNSFNRSICDSLPFQFPAGDKIFTHPSHSSLHNTANQQSNINYASQTSKPKGFRLRVIRSPYPIDRLEMFELKDGKSVFCCLLSDSRSILNSFVIYLSSGAFLPQTAPESSQSVGSSLMRRQPTSSDHLEASAPTIQLTACGSQSIELSNIRALQSPKRQSSLNQTQVTPARQLINLVREAQLRLKLAADFHSAPLGLHSGKQAAYRNELAVQFSNSQEQETELDNANEAHPQRWSFSEDLNRSSRRKLVPKSSEIKSDKRSPRQQDNKLALAQELNTACYSALNGAIQLNPKQQDNKVYANVSNEIQQNELQTEPMLWKNNNQSAASANAASSSVAHTTSNQLHRSLLDQYRFMLWSHAHFDKLLGDEECLSQLDYLLSFEESNLASYSSPCDQADPRFKAITRCSQPETGDSGDPTRWHSPLKKLFSPRSRLSFRQAYGPLGVRRLNRKGLLAATDFNRYATTSSSAGSGDESWSMIPSRANPQHPPSANVSLAATISPSFSSRMSFMEPKSANSAQNQLFGQLINTRPLSRSAIQLQQSHSQESNSVQENQEPPKTTTRRHLNSLRRQNVILMQSAGEQHQHQQLIGHKPKEDLVQQSDNKQNSRDPTKVLANRIFVSSEEYASTDEGIEPINHSSVELDPLAATFGPRHDNQSDMTTPQPTRLSFVSVTLTRPAQDEKGPCKSGQPCDEQLGPDHIHLSLPNEPEL